MKYKLSIVIAGLVLLLSLMTLSTSPAHAASSAATKPAACNYHQVESRGMFNQAGLQEGVLRMLSDGCGNVELDLHVITLANLSISLSDGSYYIVYSRDCPDAFPGGVYDCWSLPYHTGNTKVYGYGGMYDSNWNEFAAAQTGYHSGYE